MAPHFQRRCLESGCQVAGIFQQASQPSPRAQTLAVAADRQTDRQTDELGARVRRVAGS